VRFPTSFLVHILYRTFGLKIVTNESVTRVASFCCQFTPTEPLNFVNNLKFALPFQKYLALLKRKAPQRHFVLQTKPRTALLVFMPLALGFQWKPRYIKYFYFTFWFHNETFRRHILLKCIYIFRQIMLRRRSKNGTPKIEYGSTVLKFTCKNTSRGSLRKLGTTEPTALNLFTKCCLLVRGVLISP
jgi:hypothetical protein